MQHTFATVMIEHGEDILWVSHMLGHTDISMTLQIYAKYRKQENRKIGKELRFQQEYYRH
ncbi:MAG: tyrosine-type recombinase/integrase [Sulfurimonadaceae bacterium]